VAAEAMVPETMLMNAAYMLMNAAEMGEASRPVACPSNMRTTEMSPTESPPASKRGGREGGGLETEHDCRNHHLHRLAQPKLD
jgi:hypothetical protein